MRALIALAALIFTALPAAAQDAEPASADRPVVAMMFLSDFCAACRVLEPRIEAIEPAFEGRPIEFVRFDQTMSLLTRGRLNRLAEEHGVAAAWEARRGGTGFVVLVDPANGAELDMLTIRLEPEEMYHRIERALAG